MAIKTTSGFAPFSNVVDRFLPGGYREDMTFEDSEIEVTKQVKADSSFSKTDDLFFSGETYEVN